VFKLPIKEPLVAVLPSDHRLAARKALRPRDVGETFINPTKAAPTLKVVIDGYAARSGISLASDYEAENLSMAIALVASTHGVSLLPLYAKNLLPPSVVSRPLQGEVPTIDLVLGYSKANTSPLLKRFITKVDELVALVSPKIARWFPLVARQRLPSLKPLETRGNRMQKLLIAGAFVAGWGAIGGAAAQVYPSRPITMVVPFPAGGSTDTIGRIMAEGMRASLGQTVIIENVGGASGSIGVGRVARAAPDGYTLSLGSWPTHVLNAAIFTLPYDPLNDFEPVSLVAAQPLFILARKAFPASNLAEFIAWLKANPDKATQGTAGAGGASHVAGVFFQKVSGTRFQMVPYRGAAPAMQDLLAGQIDMMIDPAASAGPQVRAGAVKAYAVTAKSRLAAAPDVPTVDEAGLPGFYVASWHAIWVPKATPKGVIASLNAAVADALADPAVRQRLADAGQEIFPREQQTPEAMRAYHAAEIEKWWPVIKAANIKAD
jgi:tripartite-type tricarboxylate transporter receptor subunit TctC